MHVCIVDIGGSAFQSPAMHVPRAVFAALASCLVAAACGGKGNDPSTPTAEQSLAQVAGAPAEADACTKYANALCDKAGPDSPTCQSIKTATDLMPAEACAAGLGNLDHSFAKLAELGEVCGKLVEKLCGDLGKDTQTCAMVQKQSDRLQPDQCNEMMAQYAEVLAELQSMEQRNKPLPPELAAMIAEGDAPSFGPPDAKVKVVEFSDFECPYCARAADAVNEIKKKYEDQVHFVFRQFPLSFHQRAHLTAQASLAAHAQGKFWEFHDLAFANQKALDRDSLEKYAEQAGLDMVKFKAALDNNIHANTVDAELEMGKKVFVDGTPTMFVNGERVPNPTDPTSIAQAIDKALAANN